MQTKFSAIILSLILISISSFTGCSSNKADSDTRISILPKPSSINYKKGVFKISENVMICIDDSSLQWEANYLSEQLKSNNITGSSVCKANPCKENYIKLSVSNEKDSDSYTVNIDSNYINISGSKNGIFYGIQSLLQIITETKNKQIPCADINDAPAFHWRGMHLDVCRHFFSKNEVKKYLDYLALYKMNVFHWHLTDDQGWRIAINKYPKLTTIGAWRSGTMIGTPADEKYDTIRYGGFFTQEDIKEIVKYATERHITIVPEIEMPGHSTAAIAAHPQLSCKGGPFEVGRYWGVYDDVFCAGNDSTFIFLQDVLDEVIALFPGEYIHVGGDECPKVRWETCAKCQKRKIENNLKNEHELQSYFIQRIEKYLNSKGKKIIGWDEILEGGLSPNAAVMSWQGTDGGIAAARQGNYVVMTPGKPCYFDHYQNPDISKEPLTIGGLNTIEDVYNFNPIPDSLTKEERKYILGAQGNVWTEYMPDFSRVEYMALPRMAAMAEVLWSGNENKDYKDFIKRLKNQTIQLDKKRANYCRYFLSE